MGINVSWGSPIVMFAHQLQREQQEDSFKNAQLGLQARQQDIGLAESQQRMGMQYEQMQQQAQQRGMDDWLKAGQLGLGYAQAADQSAQHWAGLGQHQQGLDRQQSNLDRQYKRDETWANTWQDRLQTQRDLGDQRSGDRGARLDYLREHDANYLEFRRDLPNITADAKFQAKVKERDFDIDSIANMMEDGSISKMDGEEAIRGIQKEQIGAYRQAKQVQSRKVDARTALQEQYNNSTMIDKDGIPHRVDPKTGTFARVDQLPNKELLELETFYAEKLGAKDEKGKVTKAASQEEIDGAVAAHMARLRKHNQVPEAAEPETALDNKPLAAELKKLVFEKDGTVSQLQKRDARVVNALLSEFGYLDQMPEAQQELFQEAMGNLAKVMTRQGKERMMTRIRAPQGWSRPQDAEKLGMPAATTTVSSFLFGGGAEPKGMVGLPAPRSTAGNQELETLIMGGQVKNMPPEWKPVAEIARNAMATDNPKVRGDLQHIARVWGKEEYSRMDDDVFGNFAEKVLRNYRHLPRQVVSSVEAMVERRNELNEQRKAAKLKGMSTKQQPQLSQLGTIM